MSKFSSVVVAVACMGAIALQGCGKEEGKKTQSDGKKKDVRENHFLNYIVQSSISHRLRF